MKKLHEFFMYLSRRSKTRKITKGIHGPSSEEIVPLNSVISQLNLLSASSVIDFTDMFDLGPIFSCSSSAPFAQPWTTSDLKILKFI